MAGRPPPNAPDKSQRTRRTKVAISAEQMRNDRQTGFETSCKRKEERSRILHKNNLPLFASEAEGRRPLKSSTFLRICGAVHRDSSTVDLLFDPSAYLARFRPEIDAAADAETARRSRQAIAYTGRRPSQRSDSAGQSRRSKVLRTPRPITRSVPAEVEVALSTVSPASVVTHVSEWSLESPAPFYRVLHVPVC
jgi:hypothetical protein